MNAQTPPRPDDPAPEVPWQDRRVHTSDGVDLAVQTTGEGPAVLLINGIGVTRPALDMLADHLRPSHRVIAWDYRGSGDTRPRSLPLEQLSLDRHAADAVEILDALGEPRAVLLGWSMGVPVGLEVIRRAPGRVAGFGALFGSPGPPFRAAAPRPISDAVELTFRAMRHVPLTAQAIFGIGNLVPPLAWAVCSGVGFVGKGANKELFRGAVRVTTEAERRTYLGNMRHLMEHDARDVLPEVECPTLIVAGGRDWVTPPEAAVEMLRQIPHARLLVLPDASHFGIMEHGPELWHPIDRLLAEAFPPAAPAPAAA